MLVTQKNLEPRHQTFIILGRRDHFILMILNFIIWINRGREGVERGVGYHLWRGGVSRKVCIKKFSSLTSKLNYFSKFSTPILLMGPKVSYLPLFLFVVINVFICICQKYKKQKTLMNSLFSVGSSPPVLVEDTLISYEYIRL